MEEECDGCQKGENTSAFGTQYEKENITVCSSHVQVNSFVGAFHAAVILYALALNESLEAGVSISNGSEITRRMWNRTFDGEYWTKGV